MTITERFLMISLSSSAVFAALGHAHAGNRLVEHQQLGVLDQQHADLQPLLLAVAQRFGRAIELILEKDHGGDLVHALDHLLGAFPEQRADDVTAARHRQFEILEHGEVFVDGRRLEFAADAAADDLLLLAAGDLLILELDRAAGDPGASADQVEHGGLAGAVRPDDDAQLAIVDVEVEVVDGLEAVERHA